MKKKIVSFTIDKEILNKFNKIADEMCINKSKLIEKHLKKIIEENEKIIEENEKYM